MTDHDSGEITVLNTKYTVLIPGAPYHRQNVNSHGCQFQRLCSKDRATILTKRVGDEAAVEAYKRQLISIRLCSSGLPDSDNTNSHIDRNDSLSDMVAFYPVDVAGADPDGICQPKHIISSALPNDGLTKEYQNLICQTWGKQADSVVRGNWREVKEALPFLIYREGGNESSASITTGTVLLVENTLKKELLSVGRVLKFVRDSCAKFQLKFNLL